jgi:uncharacterized repeat protein (TIGR01451 family)
LTLPSAGQVTYQVSGTVSSSATGTITNTATVTAPSGQTESNTANNTDSESDTVGANVDLSVTKTDGVTDVAPGQAITYTIVVSNAGPSTATGATLTDTFSTNLTNVTFTSTATGGATGNTASGTGNLNQTLTLPAASSVTYVVTATVSPTITATTLANTATVTAPAGVTDTNTANNSATDTDNVQTAGGSIAGQVYHDANGDGDFTQGVDQPLSGVTITLTGTTTTGQSVNQTATTDVSGAYSFANLLAGSYTVAETQPAFFADAADNIGTSQNPATTITSPANDQFFVQLAAADDVTLLDFGEGDIILSKRQFLASST